MEERWERRDNVYRKEREGRGVKIENRERWDKLDRRGERNNNERKEKGKERKGERQKWV